MTTSTTMSVGQFGFCLSAPRWSWSDGMFALHGMSPGDVVPTRALFVSHVHPEDRCGVEAALDGTLTAGEPAVCAYRLIDLTGEMKEVLLALSPVDEAGTVRGFLINDTERVRQAVAHGVNAELQLALESHAAIDQAKGALMAVYGVDSEGAFQLLRWASQQRNVRLRALAERLITALQSAGGLGTQVRALVDETFLAVLDDAPLPCSGGRSVSLSFDTHADVPTLRVTGRVDLATVGELTAALNKLMLAGDRDGVVVDVQGLDGVGSVARFALAAAKRRSAAHRVPMHLVVGAHSVGETLAGGWIATRDPRGARATAGSHRSR